MNYECRRVGGCLQNNQRTFDVSVDWRVRRPWCLCDQGNLLVVVNTRTSC